MNEAKPFSDEELAKFRECQAYLLDKSGEYIKGLAAPTVVLHGRIGRFLDTIAERDKRIEELEAKASHYDSTEFYCDNCKAVSPLSALSKIGQCPKCGELCHVYSQWKLEQATKRIAALEADLREAERLLIQGRSFDFDELADSLDNPNFFIDNTACSSEFKQFWKDRDAFLARKETRPS